MTQHVLHILPSLDCSGACTQLSMVARRLQSRDFEMSVLCMGGSGPMRDLIESPESSVHVIDAKWQEFASGVRRFRSLLKQLGPDLIHVWSQEHNLLGRIAAELAGPANVIVSYGSIPRRRAWRVKRCESWLNRRAVACVVDSQTTRALVAKTVHEAKLQLIPPAIETNQTSLTASERAEIRQEWQIPQDAKLIGAIGPLYSWKRIKDLIWAADLLKVIRDDVYLVIMGTGPDRRQLERYRHHVRIDDRVRFVGQYNDAWRRIGALDCLWQASDESGLSSVVLEAMAASVPVVVTDTDAHREIVTPNETGFVVKPGQRAEFARKTRILLDCPETRQGLVQRARDEVISRFDSEKLIDRFAALYQDC